MRKLPTPHSTLHTLEDSSSVETLNPISDDDDDYSKKNRTPACEEQKWCKYFLFIYIIYIYK